MTWFNINFNKAMNENEEATRRLQFLKVLPYMLDTPGRLLYVGGHMRYGRDLQMIGLFRDSNWKIDVIEAYLPNIAQLQDTRWIDNLIAGDVMEFQPERHYECAMFWHGPEHLEKSMVKTLLEKMKTYSDKVIFGTPNGVYIQDDEYGNPYERHLSTWYKEDFERLGMNADAIGEPDKKQGNIIAWT
jgi:hypothetical protein